MDFKGKTVWVTGSSRGIGAACIKKFASLGANVIIHYKKEKEQANNLKEEVEKNMVQKH